MNPALEMWRDLITAIGVLIVVGLITRAAARKARAAAAQNAMQPQIQRAKPTQTPVKQAGGVDASSRPTRASLAAEPALPGFHAPENPAQRISAMSTVKSTADAGAVASEPARGNSVQPATSRNAAKSRGSQRRRLDVRNARAGMLWAIVLGQPRGMQ